jgi:hypothetical protein
MCRRALIVSSAFATVGYPNFSNHKKLTGILATLKDLSPCQRQFLDMCKEYFELKHRPAWKISVTAIWESKLDNADKYVREFCKGFNLWSREYLKILTPDREHYPTRLQILHHKMMGSNGLTGHCLHFSMILDRICPLHAEKCKQKYWNDVLLTEREKIDKFTGNVSRCLWSSLQHGISAVGESHFYALAPCEVGGNC